MRIRQERGYGTGGDKHSVDRRQERAGRICLLFTRAGHLVVVRGATAEALVCRSPSSPIELVGSKLSARKSESSWVAILVKDNESD